MDDTVVQKILYFVAGMSLVNDTVVTVVPANAFTFCPMIKSAVLRLETSDEKMPQ